MVARGKKVSGCEIKIWLDYAICGGLGLWGGLWMFIPGSLQKEKNSIEKKGMRQLLSLSLGLNGFQAARVSAWQESRHPVIRTTQRILFSSSWVLILWLLCAEFENKMSVFWEEPCTDGWHDDVVRLFAWHWISARLSFGYLANTEEISLALLFSVTILSPCQGLKCPLPPPSWPMVQQTLESMRVSHTDGPHYGLNNGETYLKQTREHINIRVAA